MPRVAAPAALAPNPPPPPSPPSPQMLDVGAHRDERATPPPPSSPSSHRRGSRPAAPMFTFAPSEPPSSSMTCGACHTPNPPDYRFCVTCGASLKRTNSAAPTEGRRTDEGVVSVKPASPSAPIAPSAPVRIESAPEPARIESAAAAEPRSTRAMLHRPAAADESAGEGKIVGSPVLDIAASGSTPAKLIACARCHGNCVAGSRFCKFCGAALEEAASSAPVESGRPAPPPPPARSVTPALNIASMRALEPAPPPPPPPLPPSIAPPIVASPIVNEDDAPTSSTDGGAAARPMMPPEPRFPAEKAEAPPSGSGPSPRTQPLAEPGRRAEISVLAGSPIPAEPTNLPPQRAVRDGVRRETGRKHSGRLVVIVEDGSEGRSFSLADGQLDIGRTDGDIVLEDDHYVSPRHARLRFLDGQWILRDLDSTNHVYLRIRKPQSLRDGDLLLLGLEVLQFQTVSDGERGLGHAMQHGTLLFGSPATPRRARLCQRTVEGVVRDVFHLFRDETVIGRETGDIVFTADPFLSRRHAAIRRSATSGEFSLLDLDSSNGTFIAIQGEVSLANGDFLRIGQHLFRVDLG